MENPFELILEKLNIIENLLKTVKKNDSSSPVTIPEIITLNQAAEYMSLAKQTIYRKTSEREIPHFKNGKKLYFKRSELDEWLLQHRVSTREEIEQMASNYTSRKPLKGRR